MNSMTLYVFVAVAIACVASRPQFGGPPVPIVEKYEVMDERGQYSLRYITGDGTIITELGRLVPNNDGTDYVLVKEGSYEYTSPEGKRVVVTYVADAYGFRAAGDDIPVAPVA